MKAAFSITLSAIVSGMLATTVSAQSAAIDLNAPIVLLTTQQYVTLVACTLNKHPTETKLYARYYLQRRDQRSPDENERDPDSKLMLQSLDGCFTPISGKPLPFSPQRLVNDWAVAHNISRVAPPQITNMQSLADCTAKHNSGFAHAYLNILHMPSGNQPLRMRMVLQGLTMPPCTAEGGLQIDHSAFSKLLRKALDKSKAAN